MSHLFLYFFFSLSGFIGSELYMRDLLVEACELSVAVGSSCLTRD